MHDSLAVGRGHAADLLGAERLPIELDGGRAAVADEVRNQAFVLGGNRSGHGRAPWSEVKDGSDGMEAQHKWPAAALRVARPGYQCLSMRASLAAIRALNSSSTGRISSTSPIRRHGCFNHASMALSMSLNLLKATPPNCSLVSV